MGRNAALDIGLRVLERWTPTRTADFARCARVLHTPPLQRKHRKRMLQWGYSQTKEVPTSATPIPLFLVRTNRTPRFLDRAKVGDLP